MSRSIATPKHGALSRYRGSRHGSKARPPCRCPECQAVNRARSQGEDLETGRLLVLCWCTRDSVLVDQRAVMARLTDTCGRDGCTPPAARCA